VFDPHDPYTNHPKEADQGLDPARYPDVWAPDESFSHRPLAHWLERQYSYQGPMGAIDIETLRRWRLGYHAAVALIDMQVGRVLQTLESQGLAGNTLVIFTSDHGDMMGDHNLLAKGCFFYDPCTRVPMILRAPGRRAGEVIGTPVQPHDIAATCLTAAGIPADAIHEWMPDARDLLSPPALEERGYAACVHRNSMLVVDRERGWKDYHSPPLHGTMWREGRFKLNIYQASGRRDPCPGELYDMEADPREMRNLWNDPGHRDTRERLLQRLLDWLVEQDFQGRARGEDAMPASDTYRIVARAA
jgi:arylsulfatase A-like enzyme